MSHPDIGGVLPNCPVCGAASGDHFVAMFRSVSKCSNPGCGHLYAIGATSYDGVHEHAEEDIALYRRRNERLIHHLLANGYVKATGRVLDIGSGLGHIMAELRKQAPSLEISCVEAAPGSVAHLKAAGFSVVEDLSALDSLQDGQFDAIFMVEVIEHLDAPLQLLATCRRLMSGAGVLFLTTPCGELRNGSHETAAYRIKEHVQFFTPRSLRLACSRSGFEHLSLVEMRQYHAGPVNPMLKWLKDAARSMRNVVQGRHHLIALIR